MALTAARVAWELAPVFHRAALPIVTAAPISHSSLSTSEGGRAGPPLHPSR